MKKNFDICVERVLNDEGGYSNDPNDSGGPTNFGITIGDYRRYIKRNGTAADVRGMSVEQAKEIYRERYWNAMDCDSLPSGVDYTVFDYAVNSGLGRPRKALQRFKSLSGTDLIDAINNERADFLKRLAAAQPKDQKFLRGWLLRVKRVRDFSHQLSLQKDYTTGPSGGIIAGAGIGFGLWHYLQAHPYIVVTSVITTAIVIGLIIHYIKNR